MIFYTRVQENQHRLNANEKEILQFLLNKKEDIRSVTLQQVADAHDTVPNAIMRVCKKLDFSGFSEFKEVYFHTLTERHNFINMTSLDTQIVQTKQLLDYEMLDQVLDKLHAADKILFSASGLSHMVVFDLSERFKILGKNCIMCYDAILENHHAIHLAENDVAIIVRRSDDAEDLINTAAIAKSNGATVVSITSLDEIKVSKISDFPIYAASSDLIISNFNAADRFGFFYIGNIIFSEYVKKFIFDSELSTATDDFPDLHTTI